jgi:spore coat protein U-like protein
MFKNIALLACFVGLVSLGAFAGTSGTLDVSASVTTTCNVQTGAATLAFGVYDPVVANASTGLDLSGSGTFTLQCTNGEQPYITLDDGQTAGATDSTRAMSQGTGGTKTPMSYNVYSDSSHSTLWPSTGGYQYPSQMNGTAQTVTVYGLVPKGQNLAGGSYTDMIAINVIL